MKKLRTEYNRQAKNQGKLNATLCIMVIAMMLFSACSSNNKTAAPSIFDELANNMVYVEGDSGSFYICKYEVTQKLWSEVMGDNPSQMKGDNLPVEQVNWNDCQSFIAKLNMLTGKSYRLPTETEWEYACKGGKYSKGYKYSGSNDIEKVAWYDGNSENKSHPVGLKQPNELGLYDMSGNVWEWCQDMHEGTGMCRGGSWIQNARNCDPSLPNETPQSFSINCLGLRLAL
ncbi:MAG: formylglycine-generating enzyme family protein [Bacteroidaceae bacterium]|nr:formylglycine-generating enzyme family protein [Bacteroidaceae bacterium]